MRYASRFGHATELLASIYTHPARPIEHATPCSAIDVTGEPTKTYWAPGELTYDQQPPTGEGPFSPGLPAQAYSTIGFYSEN